MSILRVAIPILTPLLDFTKIIYKFAKIRRAWHSVRAVLQIISEFIFVGGDKIMTDLLSGNTDLIVPWYKV